MQKVLERLKAIPTHHFNFNSVGEVLYATDFAAMDLTGLVPDQVEAGYSRKIIDLEPLECLVLHWAPGSESAIHFHEGFWGFVAVASGTCCNVEYVLEGETMKESLITTVHTGGIVPEPDRIIHKIMNGSPIEPLITIHFYYPALTDLDGLKIYDIESGSIGTLNSRASSASWAEPTDHFKAIEKNAFRFIDDPDDDSPSHIIRPLIPKPDPGEITSMLSAYYDDQAKTYDYMDRAYESRNKYVNGINNRIADFLKKHQPEMESMLALACGTGRRAIEIRELSGMDYAITGLDVSSEMCEMAAARKIDIVHADWSQFNKSLNDRFDAATILYAFGHVASRAERISILKRLKELLKPNAPLFLDLFNMEDVSEWGGTIETLHQDLHLGQFGYEPGDVFYSRNRNNKLAFLHYFKEEEVRELLNDAGYEVILLQYVGYALSPGETIRRDSGNLFVVAKIR
jgi:ubiquinone/menaquinone biosynthesis C-methylase UbiE